MKKLYSYLFILFSVTPLVSCKTSIKEPIEIDNLSYVNDFELIQNYTNKDTMIKIMSPRAIIDQSNNNIKIYENSILFLNKKNNNNVEIKSGRAELNNSINILKVYNDVFISLLNSDDSFIRTKRLNWDLNSSTINLDNPFDFNLKNTKIKSNSGSYNIVTNHLKINSNIFNQSFYDKDGVKKYQIEIISENGNWFKNKKILEFSSNNKQVETRIDFLSIK